MSIRDSVLEALTPYVGQMVADTCIRATALSLGKSSEDLGSMDLPAITTSIRRLLAPVAPAGAIENVVRSLDQSMRMSA